MMDTLADILRPAAGPLSRVEEVIRQCLSSAEERIGDLERHSLEGRGKLIRPAMAIISAEASGTLREEHFRFAAAAELIHMATLAHDDVIDGASLRRGRPSMNASWGNHVAVLFGDYLLSRAFELLCGLGEDGILPAMLRVTREVCEGEITQTRRRHDVTMTEEEYGRIVSLKTASLFSACCGLSAALAGASPASVEFLTRFGLKFGTAFQIADDCADILGADIGKDRFKDIEVGNVTLPLIKALGLLPGPERESLERAFRDADVKTCRSLIIASGALERSYVEAAGLMEAARADLERLPGSPRHDALLRLTRALVSQSHP